MRWVARKILQSKTFPLCDSYIALSSASFLPLFKVIINTPSMAGLRHRSKIGVFPFTIERPAQRTSINRVAGTMETKPITSITRDISKSFLIDKVIPAIREKWPRGEKGPIYIQQDNARTHVQPNDPDFLAAASVDGFDIRLMCQPPNSPDMNVLDLGFFSAIQALQYKECPNHNDELVAAVKRSFEAFPAFKSNRVFLSLQNCMIETMKCMGSNKYDLPHAKKAVLEREGRLPVSFNCDATLVHDVRNYLGLETLY